MADTIKSTEKTETPTTISKGKNILVEVNIKRDDSGVKLYIKGFNDFKVLRHSEEKEMTFAGVRCFVPKADRLYAVNGSFYVTSTLENAFMYDGLPNLCVLLAKNLKDGVTFNFGTFPLNEEMIKKWMEEFNAQVKSIYLHYCRQYNISMRISTQMIEDVIAT